MWTVYRHISPSGKIYVGITGRTVEERWYNPENAYQSCTVFLYAIKKYGWGNFKHEILFENINEISAKLIEVDLIYYYKKLKISYNITDGGQGMLGHRIESQLKPVYQIEPYSKKIVHKWDCIQDAADFVNRASTNISHATRKYGQIGGYYWLSEKDIKNIDKIQFKSPYRKRVIKLDSTSNEIIRVYDTIKDAAKDMGVVDDAITMAIKRHSQCEHYHWIFYKDLDKLDSIKWCKQSSCKRTKNVEIKSLITNETYNFKNLVEAGRYIGYQAKSWYKEGRNIYRNWYVRRTV